MSTRPQPIRVLIGKPGLDGHDVGAKLVGRALTDAGMQVSYTGLRQSPEAIAARAIEEEADVIGLSILSGTHVALTESVLRKLREAGVEDRTVIVGGVIPEKDEQALKDLGVDGVFPTGTPFEEIVQFVRARVQR